MMVYLQAVRLSHLIFAVSPNGLRALQLICSTGMIIAHLPLSSNYCKNRIYSTGNFLLFPSLLLLEMLNILSSKIDEYFFKKVSASR